MRRILRKFTFVPVLLILVGFVYFTIAIAKPLRASEKHSLIHGSIRAGDQLAQAGPFFYYAALHPGRPTADAPGFPLDDQQPEGDGKFTLSADAEDGTRFFVLARVETASFARHCETVELPPVRRMENGAWVDATTGKPLPPLPVIVNRQPC